MLFFALSIQHVGLNRGVNGAVNRMVTPSFSAVQRPVIALVELSRQVRYVCTVVLGLTLNPKCPALAPYNVR